MALVIKRSHYDLIPADFIKTTKKTYGAFVGMYIFFLQIKIHRSSKMSIFNKVHKNQKLSFEVEILELDILKIF